MQPVDNRRPTLETQHSMFLEEREIVGHIRTDNLELGDKAMLEQRLQQGRVLMIRFLSSIHETCPELRQSDTCLSCLAEQKTLCASRAASYLYDLLDLPIRHFLHEEVLMCLLASDADADRQLEAQRESRAKLLQEVRDTYTICLGLRDQGRFNQMYRHLYARIAAILTAHEAIFDRSTRACAPQEALPIQPTKALQ